MTNIKEKLFRLWVKHKYKNWCLNDIKSLMLQDGVPESEINKIIGV